MEGLSTTNFGKKMSSFFRENFYTVLIKKKIHHNYSDFNIKYKFNLNILIVK